LNNISDKFIDIFSNICLKENHDGILLSGGLDSSIIAYHTRPRDAITITVDRNSPDYFYSSLVIQKKYSINHHRTIVSFKEILSNIEELVKDFKTFDPIFLKNSVVQLMGFKTAKELKIKSLIIGDGADELFAGYNFLHQYVSESKKINQKINSIIKNMDFISIKLSKKIGLNIFLPFLEQEIINFSNLLTIDDKISRYNGMYYGKFFLRKCYEDILGKELVWRKKDALENGSGVTNVQKYIENNLISDNEYSREIKKARLEDKVEIRNKEHLYFYKIYRKFFMPPIIDESHTNISLDKNQKKCPHCFTNFIWGGNFCKVCGAFPVYFNR
jgi:asparagine synthase (glutamine-hydrolysing)